MSAEQNFLIAFLIYLAVGVGFLIRLKRNLDLPFEKFWFACLYGWLFLLGLWVWMCITWWHITHTSVYDVERLTQLLRIQKLTCARNGEGSGFVYVAIHFNGVTETYHVSEQELLYSRRHPHLTLARKILYRKKS